MENQHPGAIRTSFILLARSLFYRIGSGMEPSWIKELYLFERHCLGRILLRRKRAGKVWVQA